MARLFDDASSEYLEYAGAVIASNPLAMSSWMKPDALINQTVMSVGVSGNDTKSLQLRLRDPADSDVLALIQNGTGTTKFAATSGSYAVDVWQHVAALFISNTDRRVLLNGGSRGTNGDSLSFPAVDRTGIGIRATLSHGSPFSGSIAEPAVWDLSAWPGATDSDKADEFERVAVPSLAAGYSPLFFRLGLVAYWPLGGLEDANDGDRDVVGGYDMTAYNTPSTADHSGELIYPTGPRVVVQAGAAAPVVGVDEMLAAIGPKAHLPSRPRLEPVAYH